MRYIENKTPKGKKCVLYASVRRWDIRIICYVCRSQNNYFVYCEQFPKVKPWKTSAGWLRETFPEEFRMLKRMTGIRMYKGA